MDVSPIKILYNEDEFKRIKDEEIEAFIIASDIKRKVENHYQVMDKKTKQARDVRYDDFVILLASFWTRYLIFFYLNVFSRQT